MMDWRFFSFFSMVRRYQEDEKKIEDDSACTIQYITCRVPAWFPIAPPQVCVVWCQRNFRKSLERLVGETQTVSLQWGIQMYQHTNRAGLSMH